MAISLMPWREILNVHKTKNFKEELTMSEEKKRELDEQELENVSGGVRSTASIPYYPKPRPSICPKCQSKNISYKSSGGYHCNACGVDFSI